MITCIFLLEMSVSKGGAKFIFQVVEMKSTWIKVCSVWITGTMDSRLPRARPNQSETKVDELSPTSEWWDGWKLQKLACKCTSHYNFPPTGKWMPINKFCRLIEITVLWPSDEKMCLRPVTSSALPNLWIELMEKSDQNELTLLSNSWVFLNQKELI